ncbi:uncharacterized protein lrrc53 [Osmerus eperlanus]|uniref:uncharacterized protein lrrc53 n=1 Tax=Osmerus eperlanus TaxID=29151 RepID=UPI002E16318C
MNTWNCTCELRELAAFLSSYMEAPDKVLYNGRRLVCVSADNPAVTTVLELTEQNCVPPNQNITVQVEARASVSPRRYARDLALAAAGCFFGGVVLSLLVVFLLYRNLLSNGFLMRSQKGGAEGERGAGPGPTVTRWDDDKDRLDAKQMLANGSGPWGREAAMLESNGSHLKSRMGVHGGRFRCPKCSHGEDDAWAYRAEERERRLEPHRDVRGERSLDKPAGARASHPISRHQEEESAYQLRGSRISKLPLEGARGRRLGPTQRTPSRVRGEGGVPGGKDMEGGARVGYAPGGDRLWSGAGTGSDFQTLSCDGCHQTYEYREAGHPGREGSHRPDPRESALHNGHHPTTGPLHGWGAEAKSNHSDRVRFDAPRGGGFQRSVTFDLERSTGEVAGGGWRRNGTGEGGEGETEVPGEVGSGATGREGRAVRRGEGGGRGEGSHRKQRPKVQSSRLLKVKLNLNPLRKSKVHPRRSSRERPESGQAAGKARTGQVT